MTEQTRHPLTLGFSPCPNDTFIFHALVNGLADKLGLKLASPELADVETLNQWAMHRRLDVTKISFHALGYVLDDYKLLSSGAALGRGCGPLLVASRKVERQKIAALRIAIPGRYTTAAMLLRLFAPECRNLVSLRFDEIMPAIVRGEVDAGVIIHESRFTYQEQGLLEIQDLGAWWEETTDCPIPLGCIAARRTLGDEVIRLVEEGIKRSVLQAFENPNLSRSYIKSHAQEMDSQVVDENISKDDSDFSGDLG